MGAKVLKTETTKMLKLNENCVRSNFQTVRNHYYKSVLSVEHIKILVVSY